MRARIVVVAVLAFALAGCAEHPKWGSQGQPTGQPTSAAPVTPTDTPATQSTQSPTPAATTATPVAMVIDIGDKSFTARMGSGLEIGLPKPDGNQHIAAEYAKEVVKKVDQFWGTYMSSRQPKLHDELVVERIAEGSGYFNSKCLPDGQTVVPAGPRAFYCPKEATDVRGILYIPALTYLGIWSAYGPDSNLVAQLIASDVYSYHVVEEFTAQLNLPRPTDGQAKLMTACLTGAWAMATYPGGDLKPAATNAATAFIAQGVGLPADDEPQASEVKTAFDTGLVNGSVAKCGNTYWPGTSWK